MHLAWVIFIGLISFLWVVAAVVTARGMRQAPDLGRVEPLPDRAYPGVSILIAARNEAAELPQALASFLAQDNPHYEVIAVDDRSTDATGQILDDWARRHPNLTVIHLKELPPGWLGKPHGLQTAYQRSSGEWLVFTDADVVFAPDLLRRALALVQQEGWDHLTCLPRFEMVGFWETTALSLAVLVGEMAVQPWRVHRSSSRFYAGVGAFQLLRRTAYESIGGHHRMAMEIVDDIKLAKLVKRSEEHTSELQSR